MKMPFKFVLVWIGGAVVAFLVNMSVTVLTQNPALGFWIGSVAAVSIGFAMAKDQREF